MTSKEQDLKRVQDVVNSLGEYFDSVQIFVTRHEPAEADGTITLHLGAGNWYARYGQVTEWVTRQNEQARIVERKKED